MRSRGLPFHIYKRNYTCLYADEYDPKRERTEWHRRQRGYSWKKDLVRKEGMGSREKMEWLAFDWDTGPSWSPVISWSWWHGCRGWEWWYLMKVLLWLLWFPQWNGSQEALCQVWWLVRRWKKTKPFVSCLSVQKHFHFFWICSFLGYKTFLFYLVFYPSC